MRGNSLTFNFKKNWLKKTDQPLFAYFVNFCLFVVIVVLSGKDRCLPSPCFTLLLNFS